MKYLIMLVSLFAVSFAQADVKAKIEKLALAHVAVQALLKSSASVVMMDQKACSLKTEKIQGSEKNGFANGEVTLVQNCSNTEMDGGSHTVIQAMISADRVLIEKVEIGYSGF